MSLLRRLQEKGAISLDQFEQTPDRKKEAVVQEILRAFYDNPALQADADEEKLRDYFSQQVFLKGRALTTSEKEGIITRLIAEVTGLGPLEAALARDDVEEVKVGAEGEITLVGPSGEQEAPFSFRDRHDALSKAEKLFSHIEQALQSGHFGSGGEASGRSLYLTLPIQLTSLVQSGKIGSSTAAFLESFSVDAEEGFSFDLGSLLFLYRAS